MKEVCLGKLHEVILVSTLKEFALRKAQEELLIKRYSIFF